ncbi:MAG TPA: hypothetical protein VE291_04285 [Terracidiphilus sp.]|jgi:hypothetical protein|nr:hypothetical protein [Terracidiphilus sp.]
MNPIPILAPFFIAAAVLFGLSRLILNEGDPTRPARQLPGGGLEFAYTQSAFWGIYLFLALVGLVALAGVLSAARGATGIVVTLFCVGFAVLLLRVLPGTIVLTAQGLEQHYWLRKPAVIAWADVRSIAVNEKRREITIRNSKGAKIQHSRQFPDRERFVAELQSHCPDRMPGAKRVVTAPEAPAV